MDTRLTAEMMASLGEPFRADAVQWKPQVTNKDRTRALAVPYVDVRSYVDRLNEVMGADWSDDYQVVDAGAVVLCRLTVGGVTRSDIGEADPEDRNTATSALAQAFKRACVKFGLGAYLYRLPRQWEEYDAQARQFSPAALVRLRQLAGPSSRGGSPGGGRLQYGDGSPVGDNPAEVQSYRAYVSATGKPPSNVAALRAWAAKLPKP
ncbi:MAG: Rad52/Rad22 family DNA repair protein [Anaerolineae bacterium]|nr:Rad52/Rad22 family DNA repair protein [Anaerolineae bacterium]